MLCQRHTCDYKQTIGINFQETHSNHITEAEAYSTKHTEIQDKHDLQTRTIYTSLTGYQYKTMQRTEMDK